MDMKHLEISKIMDEYTDTEFFLADASDVDPEAVRARVLAGIKAPTERKPLLRKKKLLLVAGLVAGLAAALVLMGAGLPSLVHQLLNTTLTFEQNPDSRSVTYEHGVSSIEVEDGRLFFVLDKERTDITDFTNEDIERLHQHGEYHGQGHGDQELTNRHCPHDILLRR